MLTEIALTFTDFDCYNTLTSIYVEMTETFLQSLAVVVL